MRKPILHFRSQKGCKEAIRQEVEPYEDKPGKSFVAPITQQVLAECHYGCIRYGLVPVAFKWGIHPHRGTKACFNARFDDQRFPELRWRPISYNKAITRWALTEKTLDAEIKDILRHHALPHILAYRNVHPYCEVAGCLSLAEDVHHATPDFNTMAKAAIALMTPVERSDLIASHDWLMDRWPIPQRVLEYIDVAHTSATLQSVCKFHHNRTHAKSSRN